MLLSDLAQWLYDKFDPNYELEPDACDAQYSPHAGWKNLSENDQAYWLSEAEALLKRFDLLSSLRRKDHNER